MHVVASKPAAPARNPARDSYAGLGGRTVRLEAPDELPGSWDGPVYSTLIGDPQHRAADDSPFFDDADGRKRPAWQVTLTFLLPGQRSEDIESALRVHVDVPYWIPHWRLTQPSRNLATELLERPLLSVFRFLRFTEFFVATPRQDTKFTRHTSDVFLCGQVLDYRPATSMALVDDIDLIQEPGCSYICMVGIRGYRAERHQVVAIPLIDVRSQVISQEEFVMGFYHGLPATLQPPRFAAAWQSFCSSPADSASVRVQLGQAFPAPGAALHDVLDLGSQAVSYVTPRGTKRAEIPVDYAWRMAHPPLATMDFDEAGALPDATLSHRSPDADLPLLTRAEAELTPGDQIAPALLAAHPLAPGVHLPGPPASTRPPTSGSGPAVPPPASAPGLTGEALMQARYQQRSPSPASSSVRARRLHSAPPGGPYARLDVGPFIPGAGRFEFGVRVRARPG